MVLSGCNNAVPQDGRQSWDALAGNDRKCLDANGTEIGLWTCNGSEAQRWTM